MPTALIAIERQATRLSEQERAHLARQYLGEPLRVHGTGKWHRTPQGKWELELLLIQSWGELAPPGKRGFAPIGPDRKQRLEQHETTAAGMAKNAGT